MLESRDGYGLDQPHVARPHSGQALCPTSSRCPHAAQARGDPHDGHDWSAGPRMPGHRQDGQTSTPADTSCLRWMREKRRSARNCATPPDASTSAATTATDGARLPHPNQRTMLPATPRQPSAPVDQSRLRHRRTSSGLRSWSGSKCMRRRGSQKISSCFAPHLPA